MLYFKWRKVLFADWQCNQSNVSNPLDDEQQLPKRGPTEAIFVTAQKMKKKNNKKKKKKEVKEGG